MRYFIIVLRSLTYAQRGEGLLERAGLYAAVTKAPRHLTPEGCGYGVKIRGKDKDRALKILRDAGFRVRRLIGIDDEGKAMAVSPVDLP